MHPCPGTGADPVDLTQPPMEILHGETPGGPPPPLASHRPPSGPTPPPVGSEAGLAPPPRFTSALLIETRMLALFPLMPGTEQA